MDPKHNLTNPYHLFSFPVNGPLVRLMILLLLLFVYLFVCFTCFSVCVCLSVCLSVCLFVCFFACFFIFSYDLKVGNKNTVGCLCLF